MGQSEERATIGLATPSWKAKKLIWKKIASPTAGIRQGYTPLPSAANFHKSDARAIAVSGGWRAGKSLSAAMEIAAWLPYSQLVWLIARDYDLSRAEFIYLAEAALSTGLASAPSIHISLNKYQPCALRTINGCVVETRTLADFRKLAAKAPDLVVVCEPGLIENLHQVLELLWGRVSEKRGRILMAGTSDQSSEEYAETWRRWQEPNPEGGEAYSIPTWENRYRYPLGKNEREFLTYEEIYGSERLMAHFGGLPAEPFDQVLRGFWIDKMHVRSNAFNPSFPAEVCIDPGYSLGHRYAVELVQWDDASGKIWLIDEVALEGQTHDKVRDACRLRPWWKYVSGGTIDPYAGDTHIYGAPAPMHYWEPLQLRATYRPRVMSTVQILKEAIDPTAPGGPRLTADPKCERFIWEAHHWRQDKHGRPSPDSCDALKAVGYWLNDHLLGERAGADMDNVVIAANDWRLE